MTTVEQEVTEISGLSNCFKSIFHSEQTHNWILNHHIFEEVTIDELAQILAKEIVRFRCRRCLQHFDAWVRKVDENVPLPESSKAALRAFLGPTFGTNDNQYATPNIDHLEGFVGEWLWYFFNIEKQSDAIVHIVIPGFKSTDPGGDGLIIHRLTNGQLLFRLWEMKKFSPRAENSTQQLSATVRNAYSQLNLKATEYLARITATEQESDDSEIEEFIGMLPDLWIDSSPQASAGVSIATSLRHASENCFNDFGQQFPRFTNPVRLLGMLTGINDFSALAVKVKENVWKGL